MDVLTNNPEVLTISSDELGTLFERIADERWAELILLGPNVGRRYISAFQRSNLKNAKRIFHYRGCQENIPFRNIASLTNLTSLSLGGNEIGGDGAKAIASLTNLTSLSLDGNNIGDEGAKAIASLTNLTSLSLHRSIIGDEGAKAIASLTNLTSLSLHSNEIGDEGAKAIASLTNLTDLTLVGDNVGDGGAKAISSLTNLTSLSMFYNCIGDEGAKAIASLTNLTSLSLGGNNIGDEGATAIASLINLNSLELAANEIGDKGANSLGTLINLNSLNLASNKFGDQGAKVIGTLINLTWLNVHLSRFGDVGAKAIASLTDLTSLSLGGDNIGDEGAKAIASLIDLTSLSLGGDNIGDEGAKAIASLTDLTSLSLDGDNIGDEGAKAIASLTNLTSFKLSNSCIGDEGLMAIFSLPNLHSLELRGCSQRLAITEDVLSTATLLHELYIYDCSIVNIPAELLNDARRMKPPNYEQTSCLEAIRAHFKDLEVGHQEDRELKLIFLGNGRVGKTSISKRLFQNSFDISEESTHGISLETYDRFVLNDGGTCILNVWDFGGQDIYHGTHALFLKSRAVFIVVWDSTTEMDPAYCEEGTYFKKYPLSYWCDYIRSVSPHSPVILVQNKCDEPKDEKEPPANIGRLPHVYCSAREGRGMAPLKAYIKEACEQLLRSNQYTIGVGRAAIKKKIRKYQAEDEIRKAKEKHHQIMSCEDFFLLCEEENQHGDRISSAEALLSYLHHTGVLYYEQSLFNDQIILDQRWAIDAIYTIYHREKALRQLRGKKGRFSLQDLNDLVWEDKGYDQQEQRLFLSFMESCGICFKLNRVAISEHLTEYLAPDLLPKLDDVVNEVERYRRLGGEQPSISMRISYKFLHQDILRQLMAFIGQKYSNAVVYWANGVIFEDASHSTIGEALFEYRIDDTNFTRGQVTVVTRGPNQRSLLKELRKCIVNFHEDEDVELILVSIDDCHHWIDIAKLDDAIKTEFIVSECGEKLNIEPYRLFLHLFDDEDKIRRSDSFTNKKRKVTGTSPVYISYAWGDDTPEGKERQAIVERLQQSLKTADYDVRRDIDQIQYRDSITMFMEEIGEAPCVVAIVSTKYLQSEFCMHELVSRWSNGSFEQRTVPIVLEGIGLSKLANRVSYIGHWADELTSAKEALSHLPREHLAANSGVQAQFDRLRRIAQNADEVMGKLADMNTMTPVQLEEDEFELVRSAIDDSFRLRQE